MPSRVIRSDILSSHSLSSVSMGADWLFVRLLLACDDFGRLDGRIEWIRASCFPVREVSLRDLEMWLDELSVADGDSGPIQIYEIDGNPYIQLVNWERHRPRNKRGATSKFPAPMSVDPAIPADPRGSPPKPARGARGVGRGTGGVGRGTGDGGVQGGGGPKAGSKSKLTEFPADTAPLIAALSVWAEKHPEHGNLNLSECVATVEDWAIANGKRKHDWLRCVQAGIRSGWARVNTGPKGTGPKGNGRPKGWDNQRPGETSQEHGKRILDDIDAKARDRGDYEIH